MNAFEISFSDLDTVCSVSDPEKEKWKFHELRIQQVSSTTTDVSFYINGIRERNYTDNGIFSDSTTAEFRFGYNWGGINGDLAFKGFIY